MEHHAQYKREDQRGVVGGVSAVKQGLLDGIYQSLEGVGGKLAEANVRLLQLELRLLGPESEPDEGGVPSGTPDATVNRLDAAAARLHRLASELTHRAERLESLG